MLGTAWSLDGARETDALFAEDQCGKTFYTAALEHWPKQGWREIDALLITHAHAVSRSPSSFRDLS